MQVLINEMKAGQSVMLIGPPGVAKTSLILATAQKCGYKTTVKTDEGERTTICRASLMERVDWTGCLVPDHKLGITRQLPFSLIKGLQETKEPTILFIDDLGQAPTDSQAALMCCFDNHFFPENVVVWAASNRPGDKAGVNSLCEPLRSRFHSVYLVPTPDSSDKADGGVLLCPWTSTTDPENYLDNWVNWALDNSAPPEIVAYHRSTAGRSLYTWKPNADPSVRMADFRSWGALIDRWNKGLRSLHSISAVIGKAAAAEFDAFAKLADNLPTPDDVWANPTKAKVPSEASALWLISSILSQALQASVIEEFLQYVTRMPRIYAVYAARDAYKRIGTKISASPVWKKWYVQNQELFQALK